MSGDNPAAASRHTFGLGVAYVHGDRIVLSGSMAMGHDQPIATDVRAVF